MYIVTIQAEYYSSSITFSFDTLPDALEFAEKTVEHGVPNDDVNYPIATLRFVKDD